MHRRIFTALQTCLLCTCVLALFSCGKKAQEKSSGSPDRVAPPLEADFEEYLSKQSITCSDSSSCPTYIAKVIVRHGPNKFKACTGFLTDSDTIATSTSCLPKNIRLRDGDCKKDISFFFYERFSKGLRVDCSSVLMANEDFRDNPILNRDDVAFLKLERSLPFRRTLKISRDGLGANKNTTIIGIEQSDETNGEIKELDCPSVVGSYVNPLVTNDSSPGLTLAGCPFVEGFSGAPVIDNRNKSRVRGIISTGMDPKIRTYLQSTGLLANGLKDFILGSNFACAPTIYDNNVADEKECNKELSDLQVEKLRSNMLSTSVLFTEFRTRLEASLESQRFVRFSVTMTPRANPADPARPNYDIQDVKVTPKCFKDVDAMFSGKYQEIGSFKVPSRTFKKVMDEWGRVLGSESDNGAFVTSMSWNPKDLRKNKVANLLYWDPKTEVISQTFSLPICN